MAGEKLTCICCNKTLAKESFFNNRNKFIGEQYSICKSCVSRLVDENDLLSVLKFFRLMDIPYIDSRWQGVMNKGGNGVIGNYLKQMSLLKDKYFDDGDLFSLNEGKQEIISEKKNDGSGEIKNIEFTEDDEKAKSDVLRLLGYDPFYEYEKSDQKYLYNEIISYLDEDTLEDPFKCGVILQIVINNNQIRKANITINNLSRDTKSMVENSKDISSLTDMTTKWNQQNDKLSKENNIALKHRSGSNSKNSTLGSMMKNLRELEFDRAEQDYYDMYKSYGIKQSADISNKSIMEILHFDDNDFNNMFKAQREEIQKLQNSEMDLKEEVRKLVIENNELKLKNK